MPVLSKNWTKASEITATRKSTLRRLDDIPSMKSPTGGMAGMDTSSPGRGMTPIATPITAVTIIPKNTAPGTLMA